MTETKATRTAPHVGRAQRTSFLLLPAAIACTALASPSSWAGSIPLVMFTCSTCKNYADLQSYAQQQVSTVGVNVTPPGFVTGEVTTPGVTKILVVATQAPLSFVFNYTATRSYVFQIGTYYWTYSLSPAPGYTATDDGAIAQDYEIHQAKRATGLPKVRMPSTSLNGTSLNSTVNWEELQRAISYEVFTMVGVPKLRTMPGLLNWKLLPSISMVYKGKYYVLYENEAIEVELTDGSKVELTVTTGTAGMSVGYVKVKKITPPNSTPPNNVAPTTSGLNGAQMPSFNADLGTYTGNPVVVRVCNSYWSCQDAPLKTGYVEVYMLEPVTGAPIVDYSDALGQ